MKYPIGTKVKFKQYHIDDWLSRNNLWWLRYGYTLEDLTAGEFVIQTSGIYSVKIPKRRLVSFSRDVFEPVSLSKEEQIIAKIKYLNHKFNTRKENEFQYR